MHDIQTEAEKRWPKVEITYQIGTMPPITYDANAGRRLDYIAGRTEERELQRRFMLWAFSQGYSYTGAWVDSWSKTLGHTTYTTAELFETFLKTQP